MKAKKILRIVLSFMIVGILLIMIFFLIRSVIWSRQDKNFKSAIQTEFHNSVTVNTDSVSLFSRPYVRIKVGVSSALLGEGENELSKTAYDIKNFCKSYVNSYPYNKFYSSKDCMLEIYCTHENVIRFDDFIASDGKNVSHQRKEFDSVSVVHSVYFNDLDFQYFLDCKRIDLLIIENFDSDYNFDFLKNLEYLHIEWLDSNKDKELIEKILNHIPENCKFYVSDGLVAR